MSANPIDKNPTPNSTGNLEELFRHHLGEEAAVPPRPVLWDQIDNSLLIRQNETYRRRLTATRWVAAASLLLATLAGTGWWATRDADLTGPAVATSNQPADLGAGVAAGTGRQTRRLPSTSKGTNLNQAAAASVAANAVTAPNTPSNNKGTVLRGAAAGRPYSANQPAVAVNAAARNTDASPGSILNGLDSGLTTAKRNVETAAGSALASASRTASAGANSPALAAGAAGRVFAPSAATVSTASALASAAAASGASAGAAAPALASLAQASSAAISEQVGLLTARSASLSPTNLAMLPNGLAPLALPADAAPVADLAVHKWQYGASYTVGTFNPNINFSRAGIAPEYDYNPALGADSPALTEAAAVEYRENLRPGLSQRLALLATRHLAGHWSLRAGAEFSQATARSASTSAFVGEQLFGSSPFRAAPLRTTDFRYRTAGIPVEVRYGNPAKCGWSLYGRLGGVVSALLGVRSEVDGAPEATRTYSFLSAGTTYRRMLGSLRGAAGAQFRSGTGQWAFTLGPVAELGLVPLNAHPAQSYLAQSRPYSFGVEAGVEFGR